MIILGSKSPRRKMLLENKISKHFLTYAPNIDEDASNVLVSPILIVRDIAKRKALEVNKIYKDDIIITADTIVVLDNEILGKPSDETDAINMLKKLSNKIHEVITSYCILYKDKMIINEVISKVKFNLLNDELIINYVKSGSPLDKAGAYGIQDNETFNIVEYYEGSYDNIVGFPVDEIKLDLEKIKK
jgi:septum formation protein